MTEGVAAERFQEPLRRTLARNGALAAVAGLVVVLQRHDLRLLLPVATLALWFTLGGHYVELAFLNGVRARIAPGRVTQAVARLLVWSSGGCTRSWQFVVCRISTTAAGRAFPGILVSVVL